MRPPANHIRSTHDGQHVARFGRLSRRNGGGKLTHASAFGKCLLHMRHGGVVMAGQSNLLVSTVLGEVGPMRFGITSLRILGHGHTLFKFLLGPAFFARKINPSMFNVFPLPLARRVVHDRNHFDQFMSVKRLEQFKGVGRWQLTTHMQKMVSTKNISRYKV